MSPSPACGPARGHKGRGAASNHSGRYESWQRFEVDDGWGNLEQPPERLATTLQADSSRSVISYNRSPDVPFDRSINPYRGCEHGCSYCYARPSHAWLGLSPGLDFETRLFYKPRAPALLEAELARPGYRCRTLCLGANTDPYQPVERDTGLSRQILEVLAACEHPVHVISKSALIERDLDVLGVLAQKHLCAVSISLTSLDRELSRRMEPRAAAPQRRLQTVARLRDAGVPVQVLLAPVIPALNDHELEALLKAAHTAGALNARYIFIRLPLEIRPQFHDWLHRHYPDRAERVIQRIRDSRNGRDYDPAWGRRMRGQGVYADLIDQRFELARKRLAFPGLAELDTGRFQPPRANARQIELL